MNFWDVIAIQPMTNTLIAVASGLANSFGLSIVVMTIVIRLAMLPMTMKQLRATKAMQELQPKIAELQKKYAKDKQKLAQEQMKMYRESGMSPAGCIVPMLIQFPIWIALYQSIIKVLGVTPEDFLGLSRYLYSWPVVYSTLPLGNQFLWLDLATPDPYILLPILVGATMWVQQKMTTPVTADPNQQAQTRMMLWMMPLLFAFMTLQFPSGLGLYWVISNIISIVIQYFVTGWGSLFPSKAGKPDREKDKKLKRRIAQAQLPAAPVETKTSGFDEMGAEQKEETGYGESGDKRQDRGGGYPARPRPTRRNPRTGGGHRPKRR